MLLTPFRNAIGVARTSRTALAEPLYAPLVRRLLDLAAHLREGITSAFALCARTWSGVVPTTARGIDRCVARTARAHASLATRLRSRARAAREVTPVRLNAVLPAVIVVLVCALATYTVPGALRSLQSARPMPSPTAGVERTPPGLFLPAAVQPGDGDGTPGSHPPQMTFFREIVGGASAPAASVPVRPVPSADLVGRLPAKDRTTAEREIVDLLAGVGGTELGRQREATFTTIHALMPQSAHTDFLRGLVRIGSWQLEAARSPLRDTVHVTVRVTE